MPNRSKKLADDGDDDEKCRVCILRSLCVVGSVEGFDVVCIDLHLLEDITLGSAWTQLWLCRPVEHVSNCCGGHINAAKQMVKYVG